jgi:hypothetical protein
MFEIVSLRQKLDGMLSDDPEDNRERRLLIDRTGMYSVVYRFIDQRLYVQLQRPLGLLLESIEDPLWGDSD